MKTRYPKGTADGTMSFRPRSKSNSLQPPITRIKMIRKTTRDGGWIHPGIFSPGEEEAESQVCRIVGEKKVEFRLNLK